MWSFCFCISSVYVSLVSFIITVVKIAMLVYIIHLIVRYIVGFNMCNDFLYLTQSVSKTPGTVTPTKLVHISSPAQLQVQQNTTINSSGIVIVPNEAKRNIENNETVNLKRTSLSSTTTVSNSDEDIVSVTERTSSVLPDIINNVSAHNSSDTEGMLINNFLNKTENAHCLLCCFYGFRYATRPG